MGTLAVRLTLPLAGCVEDFHLLVSAPCRAHQEKGRDFCRGLLCSSQLLKIHSSQVNHIAARTQSSIQANFLPFLRFHLILMVNVVTFSRGSILEHVLVA